MRPLTIDLDPNGDLRVQMPGYAVRVPFSLAGLLVLKNVLIARAKETDQRIATKASPTQFNVDEAVRVFRAKQKDTIIHVNLKGLGL